MLGNNVAVGRCTVPQCCFTFFYNSCRSIHLFYINHSFYLSSLLSQVFRIQKRLREVTLGSVSWQAMADRRIELRPNYHIKISALMTLVSNFKYFVFVVF